MSVTMSEGENFMFLGLQGSGKTTYFALMAHYLQKMANLTKYLRFHYLPTLVKDKKTGMTQLAEITSDFINDCITRFNQQKWPRKTQDYEVSYACEIIKYWSIFGQPILQNLCWKQAAIHYHDYPGEAFSMAFGGENNPAFEASADKINEQLRSATGIFLMLDAEAMFNCQNKQLLGNSLTGLFRTIKDKNPKVKLALIFNKLELFETPPSLEELIANLRDNYGNAYSYLPLSNKSFFSVYTVGSVDTLQTGAPCPSKNLCPKNILEPVKWIIGY